MPLASAIDASWPGLSRIVPTIHVFAQGKEDVGCQSLDCFAEPCHPAALRADRVVRNDAKASIRVLAARCARGLPDITPRVSPRTVPSRSGVAQQGYPMNGIIHRIVMGVLLIAALLLFWYLLGR